MTCVKWLSALAGFCLWASTHVSHADESSAPGTDTLAELGQMFFFDANLSLERTQSCSTCHDPERGFFDARDNAVAGAASLGGDNQSLGDRNTPTTAYAFLTPDFHRTVDGDYVGGFFHDGRARTLADQAIEPFVNPLEMMMPDPRAVVERVRDNPVYSRMFADLFGEPIFSDTDRAYRAVGQCLAAFEATELFAPFDSRYDRYLRGEYQLTAPEELGRKLFFSQLTNCSSCHVLVEHAPDNPREPFTNYQYHNIGIPANHEVRARNGLEDSHRDLGLLENPAVEDASLAGKFKVPTLRNVAVTGPYMHNGVFKKLSTAIHFYSQYTVRNSSTLTNPETGEPWRSPETEPTINLDLLREGQPLGEDRTVVLEAFLRTLTDRRYEPLLEPLRSLR
jgi:cytochrome c peroxidase